MIGSTLQKGVENKYLFSIHPKQTPNLLAIRPLWTLIHFCEYARTTFLEKSIISDRDDILIGSSLIDMAVSNHPQRSCLRVIIILKITS